MRRLLIMLSGWVLAAMLLLAGGAGWAASQAPFRPGAFVAGQDGSRWIVGDGVRLRINFALDDTNALATLPDGPAVSTVDEAVAALTGSPPTAMPPITPVGAGAMVSDAAARADYLFQNTLASSVGSPPPLVNLGDSNAFQRESIGVVPRTVLAFPRGNGLVLPAATSVIPRDSYTIVAFFRFDEVSGYRRIADFKDGTSDTGLYVYNGTLHFYSGINGREQAIMPNAWVQVALTRDRTRNVAGYVNGVQQFSFVDDDDSAVISAADTLRFFRDDNAVSEEQSAGAVARIRLYDRPLSAREIVELSRLP
jgi:hypothetical protein